ncbi:hypothetical protein GCM10027521_31870 [Amycolatopsis cihanbeyliensis]
MDHWRGGRGDGRVGESPAASGVIRDLHRYGEDPRRAGRQPDCPLRWEQRTKPVVYEFAITFSDCWPGAGGY